MYFTQDIANKIKQRLKDNNAKAKNMLSDLSLGINTISEFSKGKQLSCITLARIADYLDCSVDYLLCRVDTPNDTYKPNTMIETIKPTQKTIMLPFYLTPASAGTGSYVDGDTPVEYINIIKTDTSTSADYIIKVSGDSMEPMFYDGDKLLIEKSDSINDGTIGVFVLNGETYVKKIHQSTLVSLNPKYSPIQLNEYDECRCLGVVLGIADVL